MNQNDNFVDLTNCDREPIHIPNLVQSHGVLLALDEDWIIQRISANCQELFGKSAEDLLGTNFADLAQEENNFYLKVELDHQNLSPNPHYLKSITINQTEFEVLTHRSDEFIIVEFERPLQSSLRINPNIYNSLRSKLNEINKSTSVREFCEEAALAIRSFTGFDRVMIYRFLEDDTGEVIGEAKLDGLDAFLGLRYPASDIPKQARELYLKQTLRFLVDANAVPSPLMPITEKKLDMSFAATRAMSPIHIEYLKNMGVTASMSVSIIKDNKLWGLIACHHNSPYYIAHQSRMVCEFLAHAISLQVEAKKNEENFGYINRLKSSTQEIINELSLDLDIAQCLTEGKYNLTKTLNCGGAALYFDGKIYRVGKTPTEKELKEIIEFVQSGETKDVFASNQMSKVFPKAEKYTKVASGVLAVRLSKRLNDYLIWFRPETIQTVNWAGNPEKPVTVGQFGERLTPRKSFELWKQEIVGQSERWQEFEISFAHDLGRSMVDVILRRVEELRRLNTELKASNTELDAFAYAASHDLKEPLRGISNYSRFILEDYGQQIDKEGVNRLEAVVKLSDKMSALLDSLLTYSRVGRLELEKKQIDLNEVLEQALLFLRARIEQENVKITSQKLSSIEADEIRIREVLVNLISNGIKYNDKAEKRIEIGELKKDDKIIFYVRDNGIGIDEKQKDDVFRIFKRLHKQNDFGGGVGAGMTIVKKIVERHGGDIWFESKLGEGTAFCFTLS